MRSRAISGLLILTVLLFMTSWLEASSADAQDLLAGIQKRYGPLSSLSVPYTREVITRSMAMLGEKVKGDLATGTLYFMPPNLLRLEQQSPREESLLSDGERLWWYIPEKKKAYLYDLGEFGREMALLASIFKGLSNAEDNFIVKVPSSGEDAEKRLELVPDPPWEEIEKITLGIMEQSRIGLVAIHNKLGGVTRFSLGTTEESKPLERDFFSFDPPQGVEVVREDGR